ncbi:MAG: DUF6448 family protein [Candidatus Latescibacterota bacterium]
MAPRTPHAGYLASVAALLLLALPRASQAHCDTMDGPVVTDAREALTRGDVTPVLKWVRPDDEAQVKAVFDRALTVRRAGDEAQDLVDTHFFETLVRLHRAGEGAPYTGLKPGGHTEPAVAAADEALAAGSADELAAHLAAAVKEGVTRQAARVLAAQAAKDRSVEAGREYVEAYVAYVHYVEGVARAIEGGGHDHGAAATAAHVD